MKFYLAILIFIVAVAIADQDDDLWKSYKVSRTISDMDYIDEDNICLLYTVILNAKSFCCWCRRNSVRDISRRKKALERRNLLKN